MNLVALHDGAIWFKSWACASVQGLARRSLLHAVEQELCLQDKHKKERVMMDVLMLALALLFFAAAIGYTYACERL